MGRSRKNKRKEDNDEGRRPRKKMRGSPKQRFWILDCQDSKRTADEESHDIELLITRCELLDDYRQRSMDAVGVNQEDAENEVTKTADDSGVNKNEEDNIEKDCPDPEGSPLIHFFDPKDSITPLVETHVEQMIVSSPAKATIEESKFPKIFVKKSRSAKRPFPKVRRKKGLE